MPGRAVTRPPLRTVPAGAGASLAVLAGALAVAATLPPAAGAAGWGARADLTDPVAQLIPGPPRLVALEDGRVLAAWRRPARGALSYVVDAAVRPAPRRAWRRMGPLGPGVQHPDIALGAAGSRAVLAFHRPLRMGARVLEDGRWTRSTVLASPGRIASTAQAAVDGAGAALVVWQEHGVPAVGVRTPGEIRVAVRAPGGTWTGPAVLAGAGSYEPSLAAGAAGALAAWVTDEPGGAAVWARSRPAGGHWGPPHRLSAGPAAPAAPGVAVNAAGEALVAWHEGDAVMAATRDGAGRWTDPVRISGDAPAVHRPGRPPPPVAIDEAGAAVVAWRATAAAGILDVRVARRTGGAPWSAPEILSEPAGRSAGTPALALRDGRAVVAWAQPRGRETVLLAREGDLARGTWARPRRVSAPGEAGTAPALVVDSRGRMVCAYVAIRRRGTPDREITVSVAERPPAPPARRPVRLTREQLLVNQRISQAALRRADAVLARIEEGLTAADIRLGSLTAAAFGPGVSVGGSETAEVVDPGPPVPIGPAARSRRGSPTEWSAEQLLVNQRISQAAVRRTALARWRLSSGLTGADVRDGALGSEHLAPGLAIVSADDAAAPVPRPSTAPPAFRGAGRRVRLSREQLLINQRISQAAVRRANQLTARIEAGFGSEDFRPGSLGGADLRPEAR